MAHGDTNTDSASGRLAELSTFFREHPVTGPEGHSYVGSGSRPTPVSPSLPFSADTVDHINACVREVAEHTRAANPAAGPLPERVQDSYAWMHDNLEHAPEGAQFRAEVIECRQYLEHVIRAGDVKVVRRHRCPKCRTLGLMWRRDVQRALCTNMRCVDRDGRPTTVSLARLAHQYVTDRKNLRRASAT